MNVYGSVRLLRHLAGALEPGEAELLESLVGQNGDGIAQVQAACLGAHGKADAAFIMRQTEVLGQTGGLLAEEQEAVDIMRKAINGMRKDDAVENILNMFARTKNNREYINMVKKNRII